MGSLPQLTFLSYPMLRTLSVARCVHSILHSLSKDSIWGANTLQARLAAARRYRTTLPPACSRVHSASHMHAVHLPCSLGRLAARCACAGDARGSSVRALRRAHVVAHCLHARPACIISHESNTTLGMPPTTHRHTLCKGCKDWEGGGREGAGQGSAGQPGTGSPGGSKGKGVRCGAACMRACACRCCPILWPHL